MNKQQFATMIGESKNWIYSRKYKTIMAYEKQIVEIKELLGGM